MNRLSPILLLALASIAMASCVLSPTVTPSPHPSPTPTIPPTPPRGPAPPLEAVKADLAQSLGVGEDAIQVLSITREDWPDSSLGCPQPGQFYLQVITPGYRIVLEHQGQRYEYHSDLGGRFILCPSRS